MHEQALMRALLKKVEAIRREQNAERVSEVRVEIGPLSGVEPLLLTNAFDQLAANSWLTNAKLQIDQVTLLAECYPCGQEFEVVNFVFRCPTCGGGVRVTRGDACQLVSVSLVETKPASESVV